VAWLFATEESTPQLVQATRLRPARQLAAHVYGVYVTGQQQAALEYRLIAYNLDQLPKFHCSNMPVVAYYCNGVIALGQ
jgi:hypothetical protein